MKSNLIKNKKGSHVGVILSFVIFITFLVFLYSAIEPAIKTQKEKDSLLNFLEVEIRNNITKDLVTSVVELKPGESSSSGGLPEGCIVLKIPMVEGLKVITEDKNGNNLVSGRGAGDNVFIERTDEKFLKIFFLDEITSEIAVPNNCEGLADNKYRIEFTKTNQRIYESAILDIIKNYESSAEELKDYFKIPAGSDFGLTFKDYEENIKSTNEENILSSIYSKETNIEYIDENAKERVGVLMIRVW